MMTKSNGDIGRVTSLLCGEFTGHRRIPHTKASDAELWCFLWWTNNWANNGDAGYLRHHRAHNDIIVISIIYDEQIIWNILTKRIHRNYVLANATMISVTLQISWRRRRMQLPRSRRNATKIFNFLCSFVCLPFSSIYGSFVKFCQRFAYHTEVTIAPLYLASVEWNTTMQKIKIAV